MNARWRRYLRFFGPNVEADVNDELRFHLESRIADFEARGMSRADAERAARDRFGDVKRVETALTDHDRALVRRAGIRETLDRFAQDLQLALRGFRRTPAFFVTATLILTVGIGMSVAMFTVFRAVLVRRLPVVAQDRIAVLWTYREPTVEFAPATKDLAAFRRESRTMSDVAGVAHFPATEGPFLDGTRSIALHRSLVTGNFFDVLGARPVLGRLLHSSDDDVGDFQRSGANASKAMVVSYAAWKNQFGGDSSIIGRHLVELYSQWTFTIVGVAPPGLDYPAGVDYWAPIWGGWAGGVATIAVGRLAPGATLAAARAEYFAIENRTLPAANFHGAHAATFVDTVLGDITPVLGALTAAVALLLLIACMNVGNLLLLRASGRSREIAIRRALGAGYGDIVRQLVIEAGALAVAGGALGFGAAVVVLRALIIFAPRQLPRMDDVQLAGAPILGAIAISSVAVLFFGVVPALFAARTNLAAPLRLDSRSGSETRRRRAVRQVLVASQVALAMVMLGGAALLARSLARLQGEERGYVSEHLSILAFSFNSMKYDSTRKLTAAGDELLARLRTTPGVVAVAPIALPPLLGTNVWTARFDREGQSDAEAVANPQVPVEVTGVDYFRVFGVPLLRGHTFSDADRESGPYVVIVSEGIARRFWPGQDPIGKRIRFRNATPAVTPGGTDWRTVIGVAGDTHLRSIRESSPTLYLPWHQYYWQGQFAVRTQADISTLVPSLRRAGHEVDSKTELWYAHAMDQLLAQPLAQPRLSALLMSSFGGVALLLAAIGLYGVMASLVRDQMREIGIRIALGATAGHVRREVLGRAAVVTGAGAFVGLLAALATSRLLATLLFNVSPTDPLALGGACAVLLAVGAVAAYLPARRATRIDPVQALRAD